MFKTGYSLHTIYSLFVYYSNDKDIVNRIRSMFLTRKILLSRKSYNTINTPYDHCLYDEEIEEYIKNNFEYYHIISSPSSRFISDVENLLSFLTYDSFSYYFYIDCRDCIGITDSYNFDYGIKMFPLVRFNTFYEVNIDNYLIGNANRYKENCHVYNLLRSYDYFKMRPVYSCSHNTPELSKNKMAETYTMRESTFLKFKRYGSGSYNRDNIESISDLFSEIKFINDIFNTSGKFNTFKDFFTTYRYVYSMNPYDHIVVKDGRFFNILNSNAYSRKVIIDKTYIRYRCRMDKNDTCRLFIDTDGVFSCFNSTPSEFIDEVTYNNISYIHDHLDDRVVKAVAGFNSVNSKHRRNFGFKNFDVSIMDSRQDFLNIDNEIDVNEAKATEETNRLGDFREQSVMVYGKCKSKSNDIVSSLISYSRDFNTLIDRRDFNSVERW